MRSTIELPSQKKAVVEIPYSKLAPVKEKEEAHVCCESKVVVTGGGSTRSSSKIDIKRMVQEMQEAYDRDVKALQGRVSQLQHDKSALVGKHEKEKRQLQAEFASRRTGYEREMDALREEGRKREGEMRKIQEERDILLRNKISEFKQVEYIDRINELAHIIRLKDCEIKQLAAKYEAVNAERINAQQYSRSCQLKLEEEISRLSLQLTNTTNSLVREQSNLTYASKLKEDQANKCIQGLKSQLHKAESTLRESQHSHLDKDKQIFTLNQRINTLTQGITELESQAVQLKENVSELTTLKLALSEEIAVCRRTVVFLNDEKDRLLIELDGRFLQIDRLKRDLLEKERVYEVRIERVVEGKDQIEQLQSTIFQLQQQITQLTQEKQFLGQDIGKLKGELQTQAEGRLKLQAQISGLKAYISKREGSFRWAVERQIEKDMGVCGERQTYKVSHVGESLRGRSSQGEVNKLISQQIGLQMQANLFGTYPQHIIMQKLRQ